MKRPFSLMLIGLILGIMLGKSQTLIIPAIISIGLFLFSILIPKRRWGTILIIVFLIFGSVFTMNQINRESQLSAFHNEEIRVKAEVIKMPIKKKDKVEINMQVNEIEIKGKRYAVNEKILGRIYYNEEDTEIPILNGNLLRLKGKVKMPQGIRNPGGFDYKLYLKSKGIMASIHIIPETIETVGDVPVNAIEKIIDATRNRVNKIIDDNLVKDHAALLKGILLGDKNINEDIREDFINAGIAHILAVSGLHVGFIIAFVIYFTKLLKFKNIGSIITITFVLVLYILLTGGSSSVIRASLMAWIYLFSKAINEKYDGISALSIVAFIILLYNPFILFTASFQLSFGAALSIILFYPVLSEHLGKIKYIPKVVLDIVGISLVVQIGTLPIALYHFNQVSLISICTNILVIPALGILLFIAFIAIISYVFIPIVGRLLFFLLSFIFQWILNVSNIFSALPFSHIRVPSFNWGSILLLILILLILSKYISLREKRTRIICFILVLVFIISGIREYIIPQPLKITFLDVGQGDSALIETPGREKILIDGGGYPSYFESNREISKDVLIPALYSKGITKLDLVIISHPHDDHMKGIGELIGEIPIKGIGLYQIKNKEMKNLITKGRKNNIPIIQLETGDKIRLQNDLGIHVLSPSSDFSMAEGQKDENNASLVIKLKYKKVSFIFTGDIEEEMENNLVNSTDNINSTVLKVAHHGSKTSSQESFIKKVKPKVCVVSVGESNNFGHPDSKVMNTLEENTSSIYRTDKNGAVEIITNGKWIKVNPFIDE